MFDWENKLKELSGYDIGFEIKQGYYHISIVFDENEGLFLHSDYEKALTIETDREHRTPLLPMRNYHISKHDFFSVSVSLEVYFKMLKGEKKFPNNIPSEGRKNHPIMFNSLATLTEEDKIAIQKLYREL